MTDSSFLVGLHKGWILQGSMQGLLDDGAYYSPYRLHFLGVEECK